MGYRVLADENVERATVNCLRKLGHDVERLDDVAELGLGVDDESITRYAREHARLILTQDDDFSPNWMSRTRQASSFSETRHCRHGKSGTPCTRCLSTSISPT